MLKTTYNKMLISEDDGINVRRCFFFTSFAFILFRIARALAFIHNSHINGFLPKNHNKICLLEKQQKRMKARKKELKLKKKKYV